MKFLEDPKNCMWLCRILPFICITIFGVLMLVLTKGKNESIIVPLMLIDFVIYGSFIMFYLPALLFEGNYRIRRYGTKYFYLSLGSDPSWYMFFAAITAGLGPVYWYWQKIDPALKGMVKTQSN